MTAFSLNILHRLAFILSGVCLASVAFAASPYKEAKGAKDHPMVSRFQGSVLYKTGTINF